MQHSASRAHLRETKLPRYSGGVLDALRRGAANRIVTHFEAGLAGGGLGSGTATVGARPEGH